MSSTAALLLNKRRLQDIGELQTKPYPGIALHIQDGDLTKACLILSPEGHAPLHLTVHIHDRYPIEPPRITIQSKVAHPNVYQDYICASILNKKEGYTPAYTLKGICIQLLSFFSSEHIEQDYGGMVDLKQYARDGVYRPSLDGSHVDDGFICLKCGHGGQPDGHILGKVVEAANSEAQPEPMQIEDQVELANPSLPFTGQTVHLVDLPNELLVSISEFMEEETLFLAARAWSGFSKLLHSQNLIQIREMQCFTLKAGFQQCRLGVGIAVQGRKLQSEFDYISMEAVEKLKICTSVQGLPFSLWLPLPFSESHWQRVKEVAGTSLATIGAAADISGPVENVLYAFMNDVTVKLCEATSGDSNVSSNDRSRYSYWDRTNEKSTLTHASEKAVESYYQLYHLLVTLATDDLSIATESNRRIKAFVDGDRSKTNFPNLGHLLVALLISDATTTTEMTTAIIKEAITRNVVWMLDSRGAGMAGLSYLESSEISDFRLEKTYEASQTSFNLLMFAHLMRKTVTKSAENTDTTRTLHDIRDELFSRHGSPPAGMAAELAASIRRIQQVKSFPSFLQVMDVPVPTAAEFTRFLRRTVQDSVEKGYSKWAVSQSKALAMRLLVEPRVEIAEGLEPEALRGERFSFFPQDNKRKRSGGVGNDGRGGGRGGHGRGRGYGRGYGHGRGNGDGRGDRGGRGRGRGRGRGGW